jgi:hypothetical protein
MSTVCASARCTEVSGHSEVLAQSSKRVSGAFGSADVNGGPAAVASLAAVDDVWPVDERFLVLQSCTRDR